MSFSRCKMSQNVISRIQTLFQIWHVEKFYFKIKRVVFRSIQNLKRCKTVESKTDSFFLLFWSLTRCKSFLFKICFSNPHFRFSLSFYQSATNIKEQLGRKSKYTQCYMMLRHQCGHIVANVQNTVTWLGEDQVQVCLAMWLDYSLAFT